MHWEDLQESVREIAQPGRQRLGPRLAFLGTLRREGSSRISPIEPYFAPGQLVLGTVACSAKAHDLRRDPRFVVHSAIAAPDAAERSRCTDRQCDQPNHPRKDPVRVVDRPPQGIGVRGLDEHRRGHARRMEPGARQDAPQDMIHTPRNPQERPQLPMTQCHRPKAGACRAVPCLTPRSLLGQDPGPADRAS